MFLHQSYDVRVEENEIILTPITPNSPTKSFEFRRDNKGGVREIPTPPPRPLTPVSPKKRRRRKSGRKSDQVGMVFGILGVAKFVKGYYLMAVKSEKFIANLEDSRIYQLQRIGIYPLYKHDSRLFDEDRKYLRMVKYVLRSANFFYYTKGGNYDLTRAFENQKFGSNFDSANNNISDVCVSSPDCNYVWNWAWIPKPYRTLNTNNIFVRLIQGSVESFQEEDSQINFWILSRRSKKMSGTRFNRRGVDLEGFASNFVHTEQIVKVRGDVHSVVMLRGSVPLIWTQEVNMSYSPPINFELTGTDSSVKSFGLHFERILDTFSRCLCVDLTKEKGDERLLKNQYSENVKKFTLIRRRQKRESMEEKDENEKEEEEEMFDDDDLQYLSFDVFKICGMVKLNIQKLDLLKELTETFISKDSFFSITRKSQDQQQQQDNNMIHHQKRVLRINCKEGLDRTHIITTFFGKYFMEQFLIRSKVISPKQKLKHVPSKLNKSFKYCWAKNGDKLSKFYAGSGALKTDRLKTTKAGPITIFINDAMKNIIRYYQNNLNDGYKQDCIDLVTSNFTNLQNHFNRTSKKNNIGNNNNNNPKHCWFVGLIFFLFLLFKPEASSRRRNYLGRAFIIFWLLIFILIWKFSFVEGKKFVNKPKLGNDPVKDKFKYIKNKEEEEEEEGEGVSDDESEDSEELATKEKED